MFDINLCCVIFDMVIFFLWLSVSMSTVGDDILNRPLPKVSTSLFLLLTSDLNEICCKWLKEM